MTNYNEVTIASIVANDYRTAPVFTKHGIDFCCRGNRTLASACQSNQERLAGIVEELEQVTKGVNQTLPNYQTFDLDRLVDLIETQFHRTIRSQLPIIQGYLAKLCKVHGDRHPELFTIETHFSNSAQDLESHMQKEEGVLFPFIRQLAQSNNEVFAGTCFNRVEDPIAVMQQEHTIEGDRFKEIRRLSDDYQTPSDACTTYRVTYELLREFEEQLHLHIHIENNILFPKTMAWTNACLRN